MKLVELLLTALTALTLIGQLGRINLGEKVFFYPNDLLIPLILICWLVYRLTVTKKLLLPSLTSLLGLVVLWSGVTLLKASAQLGGQELVISSLYLVRLILYSSLYLVIYDLFKGRDSKRWLFGLVGVAIGVAIFGFLQLLVVPDFSQIAAEGGWDPHQFRLLSSFYDPNFVGGFLTLGLMLALVGYLKYPARKIYFGVSSVILVIAIILTFSRSSYAMALTSLTLLALLKWRKLLLVIPVAIVAVAIFVPRSLERVTEGTEVGSSGSFRLFSWQNALTIAGDNLAFGVGYNTYRYAQERYNFVTDTVSQGGNSGAGADSSLLLILATTGLPGLMLWIALLAGMLGVAWRSFRRGSAWGLALLVSLPGLLIHSLFVNSLFYQWIMLYLWMMLGMSDAESN